MNADLERLTELRKRALDRFVSENWDLFSASDAEREDNDDLPETEIFNGAVLLVRSLSADETEVTLKVSSPGLTPTSQLGMLVQTMHYLRRD